MTTTDGALKTELSMQCAGRVHSWKQSIGSVTLPHALETLRAVVALGCRGAGDGVPCYAPVSGHLVRMVPPNRGPSSSRPAADNHVPEPRPITYHPPVSLGPDGDETPTELPPPPDTPRETPRAKALPPLAISPRATLQPGRKRRR